MAAMGAGLPVGLAGAAASAAGGAAPLPLDDLDLGAAQASLAKGDLSRDAMQDMGAAAAADLTANGRR